MSLLYPYQYLIHSHCKKRLKDMVSLDGISTQYEILERRSNLFALISWQIFFVKYSIYRSTWSLEHTLQVSLEVGYEGS